LSAELIAKTTQQLPQLINEQRQATIQQVLDGLTSQGDKAHDLLIDAGSTLTSVSNAAASVNTAIQSLAEFVRYVGPTNAAPTAVATNSQSFNVLDYGTAAAQVGGAASNLNALLVSINQSMPHLEELSRQATDEASRVARNVFWMGLALIFFVLAGAVAAGLTYRMLASKLTKARSESSSAGS
jgi:hypothetical protein